MRVCVVAFSLIVMLSSQVVRAATPQEIESAIERAKKWLYVVQKDGTWDPKERQPNPNNGEKSDWTATWTNWGGPTAIVTYALLAAGENPNDPKLKPAIEFLKTADLKGIYAISLRSQVWKHMPQNPETKKLLKRDAELLIAAMMTKGSHKGLWSYVGHGPSGLNRFDHSNSQYGVLGLWAAAEANLEIPIATWQMMDKAWRDNQHPSGAWSYMRMGDPQPEAHNPTITMTTAGVATLFLTDDFANPGFGINCTGNITDTNIERGIAWMGEHFDDALKPNVSITYALYGIERVGVASGHKYLGKINWFERGADHFVTHQTPDGNWGDSHDTAFGLLFMVHGNAPVVMNKLTWEVVQPADAKKPIASNWNQRPRDVANFVRWMGRETENLLNWHIVSLRVPVTELHDAPILYIAGGQTLNFSDEDQTKLKQFVEEGGLILANADCANKEFTESFRKLGQKLFPAYEFRELPADHIIYTGEQFVRSKWKSPPSVLGISNGTRELMLLLPTADIGKAWQLQDARAKAEAFQLASNIVFYTGEQQMRSRGLSHLIPRDEKVTAGTTIKLARIQYSGNWDPEPAGWRRLANFLHNKHGIEVQIEPIKLGEGKLDAANFKIAHLTGTTAFKLTATEQAELKKFVTSGGTLVVDSAGGSSAFASSAEALLAAMFPDGGKSMKALEKDHPAVAKVPELSLRRFAAKTLGKSKPPLPKSIEIDGKTRVFYSPLDLSVGMVGQTIDGISGYNPESATELMAAIVSYGGKN